MALGLAEKLSILECSPHDSAPPVLPINGAPDTQHWVPSRYNVRAKAEDGRLVLWNTLRGSMVVFKAKDQERVLGLLAPKGFEAAKEGTVDYMVRHGFLVRKGVDEYRQFQMVFGRQHFRNDLLELILLASEDCNFRCNYCYEEFAHGTMLPEVREGVKNLVRSRIGDLRHLGISWFGGEPLYGWKAIEDLAPFFLETARRHGTSLGCSMTTNGYLLTPDIARDLLGWKIDNFQITLDGLGEDHDRSRPTRDGGSTFDRIVSNLEAMAAMPRDFLIRLRVNFDNRNSPRLPVFLDFLAQRFRNDQRFHMDFRAVGKWGGPNDEALEVCGKDDVVRIQHELKAAARALGLALPTLKDVAMPGSQVCYAARPFNLLIGATGKVMKCTIALDMDEKNVIGQLTPAGDLELDGDRMAQWTEPAFEQDEQCRKCVVLPTCQGIHCPLARMEKGTQPCTPTRRHFKTELLETLESTPGRSVAIRP